MTDVTETPARWPSSGNRRVLEAEWIELLEREELARYLGDVPASRPTPLVRAIEQFNDGLFWECHETLEDLWLETAYPLRLFYHAIIKTAVGFHHAGRQNRHGATVKLGDGERLLRIFAPSFMGVETADLAHDTKRWLELVNAAEPLDWSRLDGLERPVIETDAG